MLDKDNILILFERDFIKMEKVKVRLLTPVIDNGKIKQAGDVIEVDKQLAKEIVARKRATYNLDVQPVNIKPKKDNGEPLDLDKLRAIADELEVKHQPSIGGPKLAKKILEDLVTKDKTLAEEADVFKAYEKFKENQSGSKDNGEPLDLDKLRAIADEAEVDYEDDTTAEELQEALVVNFEQIASELQIELPEDSNVEEAWAIIKAELENKK
mgnify:CR=1 FL=1